MSTPSIRRTADYVDAALALLDEFGPSAQTLGITAAQASRVLGLHRTSLYRRWETIAEFNDEVLLYMATSSVTWSTRLLAQDPRRSVRDVLTEVLVDPKADVGVYARVIASGWPVDHLARCKIRKAERAALDQLQSWFAHHLASVGRRPIGDDGHLLVGVGVAAIIEGHLLTTLSTSGAAFDVWTTDGVDQLIDRVERYLEQLTEPAPDEHGGADAVDADPYEPASTEHPLDDLLEPHAARFTTDSWLPEARRLVDPRRLATRLGVQERRLYALWPSSAEMNAAIATAVLERSYDDANALLGRLMEVATSGQFTSFDQLLLSCAEEAVQLLAQPVHATYFTTSAALIEPEVRVAIAERIRRWHDELRTIFLASQALTRWSRRPDVLPDEFASALRDTLVGLQRLAVLHPELAEARTAAAGHDATALGSILLLVARSTSLPPDDDTVWKDRAAPTLDESTAIG